MRTHELFGSMKMHECSDRDRVLLEVPLRKFEAAIVKTIFELLSRSKGTTEPTKLFMYIMCAFGDLYLRPEVVRPDSDVEISRARLKQMDRALKRTSNTIRKSIKSEPQNFGDQSTAIKLH